MRKTPPPPQPDADGCPLTRFDAFRVRHKLSYSAFARLFAVGKSTAHRVCAGQTPATFVITRRAEIEPRLRAFLTTRLMSATAIRAEITNLFDKEDTMIIPRCELTKPALKFFNLKKDPFSGDPENDAEYFTSDSLERIFDRLETAIDKRRFLALIGEIGSGKTAMRHRLMAELQDSPNVKMIWLTTADIEELRFSDLVSLILYELNQKPRLVKVARGLQLQENLRDLNKSGARVVLAIDEAHRLSDRALSALKRFWEMGEVGQAGYNRFLGVLLFGQPQLETRLHAHQFSEVVQRLQVERMPNFQKQAVEYLSHRLRAVGGDLDAIFDPAAAQEIAAKASTPLALGNLANAALMAAFGVRNKRVEPGMLEMGNEPRIRGVRRA